MKDDILVDILRLVVWASPLLPEYMFVSSFARHTTVIVFHLTSTHPLIIQEVEGPNLILSPQSKTTVAREFVDGPDPAWISDHECPKPLTLASMRKICHTTWRFRSFSAQLKVL